MTSKKQSEQQKPSSISTDKRQKTSGKKQAELLDTILTKANIHKWDMLLVGDGSGTGWNEPNGWSCVLIDRQTRLRKAFYGASNAGSVNFAELMPYFQALAWFHSQHGKQRIRNKGTQHVHVVTDSQVTALHGNQTAAAHNSLPKVAHQPLWAAIRAQCSLGYQLQFHWAARMTTELNWLTDLIAGLSRRSLMQVIDENAPDSIVEHAIEMMRDLEFRDPKTEEVINIYEVNPDATRHPPVRDTP